MTTTDMSNVVQTLQSSVLSILRSDTASLSITYPEGGSGTTTLSSMTIVDGIPFEQIKNEGFPIIIVHTPEVDEERITMTKHKIELTIHVEILDRRESYVRIFTDAVKDALYRNQDTTRGSGYWWYGRRVRSNLNHVQLEGEGKMKPIWHMNLFFTYLWTG